jgi:hypothetical protein
MRLTIGAIHSAVVADEIELWLERIREEETKNEIMRKQICKRNKTRKKNNN